MGNTLIDEPAPSTLDEPPEGNRLTLDDVPVEGRRGPSPTLIDGIDGSDGPPEPGRRRGASPTLPDGPFAGPTPVAHPSPAALGLATPTPPPAAAPHRALAITTPSAPPAAAAPPPHQALAITTPSAPSAAAPQILPAPAAPSAAAPQILPAPAAPSAAAPQILPAAAAPSAAAPQILPAPTATPAAPVATAAQNAYAPPPIAYPVATAPGRGLLAQLPAMPATPIAAAAPVGAMGLPPAPVRVAPSTPPPTPAPDAIAAPVPVAAPMAMVVPQPVAAPALAMAAPVLFDHAPTPEHAAPADAPGPARIAPGSRTLVGVAPPAAQASANDPTPSENGGKFRPPGQTSVPNPHDPTLPSMPTESQHGSATPIPDGQSSGAPFNDAAPRPRRRRTWIAAVFALLGVIAIVGVVAGYFIFVRYTPLAVRHIPAGTNVAARADLRAVGTFAPVRKHLWPVLFDRPSQKAPGKTFADRVAEATGMNPALDVREVVVASVDANSWVVIVGGNFKAGRFLEGLAKVFQEEGRPEWRRTGELLIGPGGAAIGQADDGTIVFGTEAEIATAALTAADDYKRVGLPGEGALTFAVTKEAWEEIARDTGAYGAGGALRRIRHAHGTFSLGDEPRLDVDVEAKGGENTETLAKDLSTFLGQLRLGLVLFPDQMGEKTALSSVEVTTEGDHVRLRAAWPLEGMDRGCQKLAAWIGAR